MSQSAGRQQAIVAFRDLRSSLTRNQLRGVLQGSRLRILLILVFSLIFWGALFAFFYEGFQFLNSFLNATEEVVEYVFGIFFLSLWSCWLSPTVLSFMPVCSMRVRWSTCLAYQPPTTGFLPTSL